MVKVEKIFPAKEGKNKDYSTMQLAEEWNEKDAITELLGGNGFDKRRVCFQTVKNDVLAAKGIKEGDSLDAKLGRALRIQVLESFEQAPGYQAKINPATGAILMSAGRTIYRKTQLAGSGAKDSSIQHDVVAAEVKAEA